MSVNELPIYERLRERARQIVSSHPEPDFYSDHPLANRESRQFYSKDSVIIRLKSCVSVHLENDFGHGMIHAEKVCLDAGSLMIIEADKADYSPDFTRRRIRVVQCAALLHDIYRKRKNHALHSADFARDLLQSYPLTAPEVNDIFLAIRNHEAFQDTTPPDTPEGQLVSDCLYDADKFRWGPDNFYDTLWDMVSFLNPPLSVFIARYPKGMESLARIKDTFRTETGKKYGPQFIDIGLSIGRELFHIIQTEFNDDISPPVR